MPTGTVTYFDSDGGYGFIETGATRDNVFFHISDTKLNSVTEGVEFSFDIDPPDDRGDNPRATNITEIQ